MKKKIISVVIPTYNEELNINNAYFEVKEVFQKLPGYDYEIVFADNCSTDSSQKLIRKITKKDKKVTAVFLSRNFGGEYSSLAGMKVATGNATTVLDCDLQDPPELIIDFIKQWEKGNEVVIGYRRHIEEKLLIKPLRIIFYKLFKLISNIDIPLNAGTFSLVDRRVMEIINNLPERNRFFRGLRAWAGFKVAKVEYVRRKRKYGQSQNTIVDYIRDAERGFFGFSFVPLEIVTYIGFVLVIVSFIFIIGYILLFFLLSNPVPGFMTIISLITFLGGIQILAISIIGKYVQIIFEETKSRPPFIIREIINDHRSQKSKSF